MTAIRVRIALVVVTLVLAVGSSAVAVGVSASGEQKACQNQQALVDALHTILDRSTERIPQFVKDGTITQAQADQAYVDNAKAKAEIVRPSC